MKYFDFDFRWSIDPLYYGPMVQARRVHIGSWMASSLVHFLLQRGCSGRTEMSAVHIIGDWRKG